MLENTPFKRNFSLKVSNGWFVLHANFVNQLRYVAATQFLILTVMRKVV